MQTGLTETEHPAEPPQGDARCTAQSKAGGFDRMMVNALRQRIAPLEAMHEALGQCLDDTDFQWFERGGSRRA